MEGSKLAPIEGATTLPETNLETQKGPYKDYSPSKRGLYGFHVSLGECNASAERRSHWKPRETDILPKWEFP